MLGAATALGFNATAAGTDITVASQNTVQCVIYPGICEIDINGDGILDLIYSGLVRDKNTAGRTVNGNKIENNTFQMVWNSNTNSYDITEFPYYFGNKPYFAVADWNGDGKPDFYVTGEASMALHDVEFGMFLNNGDGTFERGQITVFDESGAEITPFDPRTVDVADFNSDGLLDMVVTGWKNDASEHRHNYNMVLINLGDMKFKATNTELLKSGNNTYELALNSLVATDLNNDGYADFLTQGNVDNADAADKPVKNGKTLGRTFVAALNVGAAGMTEGVPVLYNLDLANGVSHHFGHGGIEVCDFNNDGVPDILVGGESPNDARGDGQWGYFWQLLHGNITADGVTYTDVTGSQMFNGKAINPLNDAKPIRAIDYNGNGLYDLFMPGWSDGMLDGTANTQAGWFFPNNSGTFDSYVRVPGASEQAVFFTEDGVSGARNYGFLGQSWDSNYFDDASEFIKGRMMMMSRNPFGVAERPDTPASVKASVNDKQVTLEWEPAESSQNNVTYDYYIKNTDTGKFYRGITATVGGENDGVRNTIAQGRAFMARKLTLNNIPVGNYEVGVQTVNAALQGSPFKTGTFAVLDSSVGVNEVVNSAVRDVEFYDIAGRRLNEAPVKGIVIRKNIHENGSVSVVKEIF